MKDWLAAWMGDAAFDATCTPDLHYEDPVTPNPLRGPDQLHRHAAQLRAAFPDFRIEEVGETLVDASRACVAWRALGTHKGDLGVLPATNEFVIVTGLHYLELDDGRIRRARSFFDLYDAAQQIGLLPKRGGLGETALLILRGFGGSIRR